MFNISSFLQKVYKHISSTESYKKQILEIIENQTQLKLSLEQVKIENYTIYIKASPSTLNKIFIYKNKILNSVANLIPIKIVDIR